MRIKEGYSWHFPELAKIITDNETYTRLVALIGNKANISKIDIDEITDLTSDESLSKKIVERTQSSVGNTLSDVDEASLVDFAEYVIRHFDYKRDL
jgi:nucleolar protein 56